VEHEDVVCKLFPYTFENKSSTWYFNFPIWSIADWGDFKKEFIDNFDEEYTLAIILKELIEINMDKKEWVKCFDYHFTNI
jgi:hypothetical protein